MAGNESNKRIPLDFLTGGFSLQHKWFSGCLIKSYLSFDLYMLKSFLIDGATVLDTLEVSAFTHIS